MAPRANGKGFLRLSLVTCPVALYPATSDSEKISFNQINRSTGHRIKYLKVDADTGEEVASDEIMKGYKVDNDTYIEISKDELENIALDSTRTIEIDEFVPKAEHRSTLSDQAVLPRAGRQGRPRCIRRHPRDHPQHEQGRNRAGRAHEP
jgi:Ku protein